VAWRLTGKLVRWTFVAAIVLLILFFVGWWLWGVLADYVAPKTTTDRKDLISVFVLSAAGIVGFLTAMSALANVYYSRRNLEHSRQALEQQRELQLTLEDSRAQDDALQAYFERMGDLLTQQELKTTERSDVKGLAQALTFTLARRLDGTRKAQLVHFLYETGLIDGRNGKQPILHVDLIDFGGIVLPQAEFPYAQFADADLRDADFRTTMFPNCDFSGANLSRANFRQAPDLSNADFRGADLAGADFRGAVLPGAKLTVYTLSDTNFEGADLRDALVTDRANNTVSIELFARACKSLKGATLPNGQKYEDWLKDKASRREGES
jgi:uncharacterized protein YjbI with pentapeptide repeats